MNQGTLIGPSSQRSILMWAVQRRIPATISVLAGGCWHNYRSQLLALEGNLLRVRYPAPTTDAPAADLTPGEQVGVSFRRGHKKCLFVSTVVLRQQAGDAADEPHEALVLRVPEEMRELQRRAYQRVIVPPDWLIAARVFAGGLPLDGEPAVPSCAGRIRNISVGGVLVDIRADQNPRLGVGDIVGLEITPHPGRRPLLAEAQYRHCAMIGADRIGLGMQLLGLEHNVPGRASIVEVAALVKEVQREAARRSRSAPF